MWYCTKCVGLVCKLECVSPLAPFKQPNVTGLSGNLQPVMYMSSLLNQREDPTNICMLFSSINRKSASSQTLMNKYFAGTVISHGKIPRKGEATLESCSWLTINPAVGPFGAFAQCLHLL